MQEQSNYYSIIPMQVLLDKKLTDREKIIYAELTSLDSKKGYAWVSNGYLAKLFDMNSNSVSRCLAHLQEYGYIKCEYGDNNSRQIVLTKGLTPINTTVNPSTPYSLDPINTTVNKESIDEKVNLESIEKNTSLTKVKNTSLVKPDEFIDYFSKVCPSLPQIKAMTDKRKKAINSIIKQYGTDKLVEVLKKTEASDFLSGRNGKWCSCNIDWIIKSSNFIKILEGNYDNIRQKETEEQKLNKKFKETYIEKNQYNAKAIQIQKSFDDMKKYKEMFGAKGVEQND